MRYKDRVKKHRGTKTKAMEKPMCNSNGTLVGADNYSSPVPVIGLYIAGGSLVCFILILCDIYSGLRHKKLWIPCRFFSLNSLTLTLISIATKIPVDLTTAMPSVEDQLSKLTGTVFICVTMCFVLPSIGTKGDMENLSNIAALSLSVVAVIVNVCMQMATGLIFSFIVEHSIILFFMLLLVLEFWLTMPESSDEREQSNISKDSTKHALAYDNENVKHRLYVSYVHSYMVSPQFVLCRKQVFGNVLFVCTICLVVLIEAIFRVVVFEDLKFCDGLSDYKWSIWLIVVIQILTVVVVSLAIFGRWLTYVVAENSVNSKNDCYKFIYLFTSTNFPSFFANWKISIICSPLYRVRDRLADLHWLAAEIISSLPMIRKHRRYDFDSVDPILRTLVDKCVVVVIKDPWVQGKALEDMGRCITENIKDFPKHLVTLLSTTVPPPEAAHLSSNLSCVYLILLAEFAKLTTPASLNIKMITILDEVFDDIYFVDTCVNKMTLNNRSEFSIAKGIWKHGLSSCPIVRRGPLEQSKTRIEQFPWIFVGVFFRQANDIYCHIEGQSYDSFNHVYRDVEGRSYASSQERYDYIEQTFAYMLGRLLAPPRLTEAIFKHISESPMGEYEDRVRHGFKLYCKYEAIESLLSSSSSPLQQGETEQHEHQPS